MVYLAKPDETYEQHAEACYASWRETMDAMLPQIRRVANLYGFSVNRFRQGSLLALAFHDVGKLTQPFQDMMHARQKNISFDYSTIYRHELISSMFLLPYWVSIEQTEHLSKLPLEIFAVAAHHRRLDSDLSSFEKERLMPCPPIFPGAADVAVALAMRLFDEEHLELPVVKPYVSQNPYNDLLRMVNGNFVAGIEEKEGANRTRAIYALYMDVLNSSDWHGSAHISVDYAASISHDMIVDTLSERCIQNCNMFSGPTDFQRECESTIGNIVAIAPTGSGKTEAAMMWCAANLKYTENGKVIYLLPTTVTSNAMWRRMCQLVEKDHVALVHSSASLVTANEMAGEGLSVVPFQNRKDMFSSSFMKPFTIATIDQLLQTAFNVRRWSLRESNAANSMIIIDEVHAYEPWTLGLLVSTIRYLQPLGARFMLMTATMPSNLRSIFQRELHTSQIISDTSLMNAKRSKYYYRGNTYLADDLGSVEQAVLDGHRVLVVVNTVAECQKIAMKLEHLSPICYHSRFVAKDRRRIEKYIEAKDTRLVIATQALEVSLNIDYDWLFTECAPPDAIAQRAGRVNRYRDPNRDSRVFIYKPTPASYKVYESEIPGLLRKSLTAFEHAPVEMTERDLAEIVDKVYVNYRPDETPEFRAAIETYSLVRINRNAIFDSPAGDAEIVTRKSTYETVTIVPLQMKEEFLAATSFDRRDYEVALPAWYVKQHGVQDGDVLYCEVKYDPVFGAELENSSKRN